MGQEETLEFIMYLLLPFLLLSCISNSQVFSSLDICQANSFCKGIPCDTTYDDIPCKTWNPTECESNQETACPSGYIMASDGSKCYIRRTGQATWNDAWTICTSYGDSGLATISSAAQQEAVNALLGSSDAYIGLNDITTKGVFVWTDGSSLDSYTNWGANYPRIK